MNESKIATLQPKRYCKFYLTAISFFSLLNRRGAVHRVDPMPASVSCRMAQGLSLGLWDS